MSGLTAEEIKVVWRTEGEEYYLQRFDLAAFQKVNEKRQAEGRPTIGLGAAADVDLSAIDMSAIDALTAVIEAVVIAEIAKYKTVDELNKRHDPILTPLTLSVADARRKELKAAAKAERAEKAAAKKAKAA